MNTQNLTPNQLVWSVVTHDGIPTQARFQFFCDSSHRNPGFATIESTRTGSVYAVEPARIELRPPVKVGQTVYVVVTPDGVPTAGRIVEITGSGIKMQSFKSGKFYDVADDKIFFTYDNAKEMHKLSHQSSHYDSTRYVKIKYDRDWTWLFFDQKPSEIIRGNLKSIGFAWSGKREGWYAEKKVEIVVINAAIDATEVVSRPEPQVLLETKHYRVIKERDWIWVHILSLSPLHEAVCNSLAGLGAKCSARRNGDWFFKQAVEVNSLQSILA